MAVKVVAAEAAVLLLVVIRQPVMVTDWPAFSVPRAQLRFWPATVSVLGHPVPPAAALGVVPVGIWPVTTTLCAAAGPALLTVTL